MYIKCYLKSLELKTLVFNVWPTFYNVVSKKTDFMTFVPKTSIEKR